MSQKIVDFFEYIAYDIEALLQKGDPFAEGVFRYDQ